MLGCVSHALQTEINQVGMLMKNLFHFGRQLSALHHCWADYFTRSYQRTCKHEIPWHKDCFFFSLSGQFKCGQSLPYALIMHSRSANTPNNFLNFAVDITTKRPIYEYEIDIFLDNPRQANAKKTEITWKFSTICIGIPIYPNANPIRCGPSFTQIVFCLNRIGNSFLPHPSPLEL